MDPEMNESLNIKQNSLLEENKKKNIKNNFN